MGKERIMVELTSTGLKVMKSTRILVYSLIVVFDLVTETL